MYKVELKKREPLFLDDVEGFKVKQTFEDPKIPYSQVISIRSKDLSFRKKEIDFVGKHKEQTVKSNKVFDDVNEGQKKIYLSWRDKTPKEKSERKDFLLLFRQVFIDWDENIEAELTHALKKFFEQNPKRTYGDGTIYSKYLQRRTVKSGISVASLRLITSAIGEDVKLSYTIK